MEVVAARRVRSKGAWLEEGRGRGASRAAARSRCPRGWSSSTRGQGRADARSAEAKRLLQSALLVVASSFLPFQPASSGLPLVFAASLINPLRRSAPTRTPFSHGGGEFAIVNGGFFSDAPAGVLWRALPHVP